MKNWVLFLCVLTSCAPQQSETPSPPTSPVQTAIGSSAQQLVQNRGEPKRRVQSPIQPGSISYEYADGESFQVDDQKVTAHFRKPTEQESSLYYWKLRAGSRKTNTITSKVRHSFENQFLIPSLGMGVVYDSRTQKVLDIVEFAGNAS